MPQATLLLDPAVSITLADTCVLPIAAGAVTNTDGAGPTRMGQVTVGDLATYMELTVSLTNPQFNGKLYSTTALATPSAFAATQGAFFASTVSGATLMGYGTTADVTLKNRAGTDVLLVGPNTTAVSCAGVVGIGSASSTSAGIFLGNAALTGTAQYGAYLQPTASTAATVSLTGLYVNVKTVADTFTCTDAYGVYVASATKGAGSTVTNYYGVYIAASTAGGTLNYGLYNAGKTLCAGEFILGAGNAVSASVATASTHKVAITIDGNPYYLLATT